MIRILDGIAEIAGTYRHYIIDLWGVLHDGAAPYPEAPEALRRLKASGARIALLSNAPRPAEGVRDRLRELGYADDTYDVLMTSGEDSWRHLQRRPDDFYRGLGQRIYLLGLPKDEGMLADIPFTRVERVEDADVILNTGVDFGETVETARPALDAGLARGLPMICANPDIVIVTRGREEVCAGALARYYEQRGGAVRYHGKPYSGVYDTVFGLLGHPPRDSVLAIGDGLHTDIKGASGAGIASVLVTGGIHAREIGVEPGARPDPAAVARYCDQEGHAPTFAIGAFRW